MATEPIKTLELYYPVIQILTNKNAVSVTINDKFGINAQLRRIVRGTRVFTLNNYLLCFLSRKICPASCESSVFVNRLRLRACD